MVPEKPDKPSKKPAPAKGPYTAAKKTGNAAKDGREPTREEKLAEALRANLKRRKQAARSKKD